MNGFIKSFIKEKGYGFIAFNDESIFFHISNVKNSDVEIFQGLSVEFEMIDTTKGKQATNVVISENKPKSFIKVGNDRIKLSNIKAYGIDNSRASYQTEVERLNKRLDECNNKIRKTKRDLEIEKNSYYMENGYKDSLDELNKEKVKLQANIQGYQKVLDERINFDCLKITTYQRDEYKYYQTYEEFNIYEKMSELDKALL